MPSSPPSESERSWSFEVTTKVASLPAVQAAALRLVYARRCRQSEAAVSLGISPRELQLAVSDGLRALASLVTAQP